MTIIFIQSDSNDLFCLSKHKVTIDKISDIQSTSFNILNQINFINDYSLIDPFVNKDFQNKFFILWKNIHKNYFSSKGIPYYSLEKFIIDQVDYGHLSTSDTICSVLWLDTIYARFTKDWSYFYKDWDVIEQYFIPDESEQINIKYYNSMHPSSVYAEYTNLTFYPANILNDEKVGLDPLYKDLKPEYGNTIYLMHEVLDADNWYKFGQKQPVKIQFFERGINESLWQTIPHPCYDKYGRGEQGFADIYSIPSLPQWHYYANPNDNQKLIQIMYWAQKFAQDQGIDLSKYIQKTIKIGNYLRYTLFDKYFRVIGQGKKPGRGYESCSYLVDFNFQWGSTLNENWSWHLPNNNILLQVIKILRLHIL